MRPLSPLFLALACPLVALAGGDYGRGESAPDVPTRSHRVQVEVEADFLSMTVELTIKGKDRAAVDTRLEAILSTLRKRFAEQDGWEALELERTFAAPVRKSAAKSSFSLVSDDDEPRPEEPVVATARYALRGPAENGLKTVEILRAKASDLVNAKSEDERLRASPISYGLANPEDHRDELLDQIKEDVANARGHLPEGELRLEVAGLAEPVQVRHLGGRRFVLSLNYRLGFVSPKPEKAQK